jgi:hypothetical protein
LNCRIVPPKKKGEERKRGRKSKVRGQRKSRKEKRGKNRKRKKKTMGKRRKILDCTWTLLYPVYVACF